MSYYYADDIIEKLKNAPQLIVFGAGNVASLIIECLRDDIYNLSIEYCLVSNKEKNPRQVKGISVIDYTEAERLIHKDAVILIAVAEKYFTSALEGLDRHGYRNIIPLTFENDLWSLIRGNVYRNEKLSENKLYLTLEEELSRCDFSIGHAVVNNTENMGPTRITEHVGSLEHSGIIECRNISIYSARCHVDKELNEDVSSYSWEIPIQVGAALTDKRICDICDNTGKNISDKNKQYCELTALYWIWKNDKSDYAGLGHYRRHFELNKEQLELLIQSDIDVVLTIPIMDIPSVEATYRRDHIGKDWDMMLEAIEKLAPEYMDTVRRMQSGRFYYAYNMFIMRREILDNYCEWLFPILFYCEERCENSETGNSKARLNTYPSSCSTLSNKIFGRSESQEYERGCEKECRQEKRDAYQNRYIGFLAEHLMSVYFMHHEEEYKIVHARKHFIL